MMTVIGLCAAFCFGWAAKAAFAREERRFQERLVEIAPVPAVPVLVGAAPCSDVDGNRW